MRRPSKSGPGVAGSERKVGDKASSRIFRGRQYGTGGSDPTAIHTGQAAGGDLGGTYPNPTVPALAAKQPLDATLTALAALAEAADQIPYFTGAGAAALTAFTTQARQLLDDTSFTQMRVTLGLAIGTDVAAQTDTRFPTTNEKAALAGTYNSPAAGNPYVTDLDPRLDLLAVNLPTAILAYKPEHYWSMATVTDQGSGGHNGTAAGGVTVGAGASLTSDGGASTDFDGVDDRITSSYAPFSGNQRTFFGVASRDTSSSADTLFGGSGVNTPRLELGATSNSVDWSPGGGGIVTWSNAWPGNAIAVVWAVVVDNVAATAELFINGVSKGIKSISGWGATPGTFQVGAQLASTNPFDGKIAHVAVWNALLTASSIQFLSRVGLGRIGARDWGLVTTLPTAALPGDRCAYIASPDSAAGVCWNLIYDGQGSYPWKYVGGSPLLGSQDSSRGITSTTMANVPTDPITVTLPLAGDYDVEQHGEFNSTAAGANATLGYKIQGTAHSDNWGILEGITNVAGSQQTEGYRKQRHTGRAAADVITEQARVASGTSTILRRRIWATPVRVG